jgi:hypothetical protein
MANVTQDRFSKNAIPMENAVAPQGSPIAAATVPQSDGSGGQEFIRNPVPVESPPPSPTQTGGMDWLQIARDNYNVGKNYFDIAIRRRVEDNLAHAFSRHASGSKYYDPSFDKRSKFFRPKTRAMMRQHEAACAIAFFSTMDVVCCQPIDSNDDAQVMAAEIHTELLNHRLRTTIPWFKILLGGHWDAQTQGVVISCQEWRYQETEIVEDEYDESGQATGNTRSKTKIVKDTPWVRLLPVENLTLHPSCDWADPINSSPYLIEAIPYFANELAERIKRGRNYGTGVEYIRDFTEQELLAGASDRDNTASALRMQRENTRLDRFSQAQQGQRNRPVWVHRNIVRVDGQDFVYETLGTTLLLSNPQPLDEVFGIDERPYAMGSCTIESHRPYPAGPVEMVRPTQEVMNELQNLRTDNLRLALNNRFLVKRGQMVDMKSLLRNVPGSVTMTTDPTNDVKQIESKDVTVSAYQEQDRLNLDFDSTAGVFSQSTVGSARNFNERVRGMELMGSSADMVTELELRTLSETWVSKALQQLVKLESALENDQVVLAIVGARVQADNWMQAFRLLSEPVRVTVAVGFGNTDPLQRVQRLISAVQAVNQAAPMVGQQGNQAAIAREIMGALGYSDGSKFYPAIKQTQQDPQVQQLQQQVQQLQQQLQSQQARWDTMIKVAQIKTASSERIAQIKAENAHNIALGKQAAQHYVAALKDRRDQLDQQIAQEKNVIAQGNLILEREALSNAIMQADREFDLKVATSTATPPAAQPHVGIPAADEPFIRNLQQPQDRAMTPSILHPHDGRQPKLPGPDHAGAIQRSVA